MEVYLGSNAVEKLRSLVWENKWDYCILWKLSQHQRGLEWDGCCCGGVVNNIQNAEEKLFQPLSPPHSTNMRCRDSMLQHPRTRACEFLADVPSSINLDSSLAGAHAEALISNQPRWVLSSDSMDSSISNETVGTTQVLVPFTGGLVELFVAKHVQEDFKIIDCILSHFNYNHFGEHEEASNYAPKNDEAYDDSQPWISSLPTSNQANNTPWDNSTSQMCMNQLGIEDGFFEGDPILFEPAVDNGMSEIGCFAQPELIMGGNIPPFGADRGVFEDIEKGRNEVRREKARESECYGSDGSIHGEDEDEKNAKGDRKHNSKNLMAERKRRKKLNDRLYLLRSIVPIISKMDRASILGDAIEFVKKLQVQVKELQDELEKSTSGDEEEIDITDNNDPRFLKKDVQSVQGNLKRARNSTIMGIDPLEQNQKPKNYDDDGKNQMEVQVEVTQINRTEFYVKIFCEHKLGGLVKLMEAMNSLGLEVTNANVTSFKKLVLNIFRVEKRDNEVLEADQVRDSLLKLTGSSKVGRAEPAREAEANNGAEVEFNYQHPHHLRSHSHLQYFHNQL